MGELLAKKIRKKEEKRKVFNIKNAKERDYIWNKDIIRKYT